MEFNPWAVVDGDPLVYIEVDEFVVAVDDGQFHIGQTYDAHPAKTIKCIKCGCREFNVGLGPWFTAIRCPKCQWEICIYDG